MVAVVRWQADQTRWNPCATRGKRRHRRAEPLPDLVRDVACLVADRLMNAGSKSASHS
jgi:hypothetical protein